MKNYINKNHIWLDGEKVRLTDSAARKSLFDAWARKRTHLVVSESWRAGVNEAWFKRSRFYRSPDFTLNLFDILTKKHDGFESSAKGVFALWYDDRKKQFQGESRLIFGGKTFQGSCCYDGLYLDCDFFSNGEFYTCIIEHLKNPIGVEIKMRHSNGEHVEHLQIFPKKYGLRLSRGDLFWDVFPGGDFADEVISGIKFFVKGIWLGWKCNQTEPFKVCDDIRAMLVFMAFSLLIGTYFPNDEITAG